MSEWKIWFAATFISAATLFTGAAQAMPIWQFDKMAASDQGDYIQLLVDGAQNVLLDGGRRDLAAKVLQLFTEIPRGDKMPLGLTEFEVNLARVRLVDAKNVESNHEAPRLEVEHAMILTLKNNGIVLPQNFMHVADNFHAKLPLAAKN